MVGYIVGYIVISGVYVWLYYDGYVYITINDLMYMSDDVGHIVGKYISQNILVIYMRPPKIGLVLVI